MSRTVDDWVRKAENDIRTAEREIVVRENPNYDAVCFHAQQAAEKMMKAVLIKTGRTPNKIHDLMVLAKELKTTGVVEMISDRDLIFLSRAAVTFRYPGESADYSDAQDSLRIAHQITGLISKYL